MTTSSASSSSPAIRCCRPRRGWRSPSGSSEGSPPRRSPGPSSSPSPPSPSAIVRAKRTLAEAMVPFEVPRGDDLSARLPSVLEVVYLVFNEGYAATRGDDWIRFELCDDALRLGRILAGLVPGEAEVHGLVATDGIAGFPAARPGGPGRRGHPPLRPGPFSVGPAPRPSRARRAGPRRGARAAPRSRTRSRPRSPRATPVHAAATRPTGSGSSPSTTRWWSSPGRRWSS